MLPLQISQGQNYQHDGNPESSGSSRPPDVHTASRHVFEAEIFSESGIVGISGKTVPGHGGPQI